MYNHSTDITRAKPSTEIGDGTVWSYGWGNAIFSMMGDFEGVSSISGDISQGGKGTLRGRPSKLWVHGSFDESSRCKFCSVIIRSENITIKKVG